MTATGQGQCQGEVAPDGGWGWLVAVASFMVHMVLDGITYSYGIFVIGLLDYFGATRQQVGWVGSIMIGVTYGAGPLASALCSRLGFRVVTILGSLIAALGLLATIFCTSILQMLFTFGIITGLGLGIMYLPAIVCVATYFDRKRSLAVGIACCGSGVGTLVFGWLAAFLLAEYGWRGGMLIEAGLVLNCCAFAMVFVTPHSRHSTKQQSPHHTASPDARLVSNDVAIYNANDNSNCSSQHRDVSMETAANVNMQGRDGDVTADATRSRLPVLVKVMTLLKSELFMLFTISGMLACIGYLVPYIFLPDRAVEMGLTVSEGAWLIEVLGIANTIARFVVGFLSDYLSTCACLNRTMLYCTAQALAGVLTAASVVCVDLTSLAVYSALYGFFMGMCVLLTSVSLVDLLSVEKLSMAFGLAMFFQSISTVIGPPIAGALYDATGGYDVPFLISGLLMTVSGAMLYIFPCLPSYRRRVQQVVAEARLKQQNA